jgi:hypothetical protein
MHLLPAEFKLLATLRPTINVFLSTTPPPHFTTTLPPSTFITVQSLEAIASFASTSRSFKLPFKLVTQLLPSR